MATRKRPADGQPDAEGPADGQPDSEGSPPTICVLGATGVGKGSTLNSCFRSDAFSTSQMFASDTIKPVSHTLAWRGAGDPVRGVDLCGFSDSEGRDTGFIEGMVSYLRDEIGRVDLFLLLLNSQEPRIGMHLKDMLAALKSVFGPSFLRNVMVGFTRWDYTRKGALLRRGVTKAALASSVNGVLRQLLGHEHDCECTFLDNTLNLFSDDDLEELHGAELPLVRGAFDEALETVRLAAIANRPFHCAAIEATLSERDVGRDLLEREAAAIARGHEAEGFASSWELTMEEPAELETKLRDAAGRARDGLHRMLAATTRPDLEHVMKSVLASFDASAPAAIADVLYRDRSAAASSNRALRMRLTAECTAFIADASRDPSRTPRQAFDAIHKKHPALIGAFLDDSRGGALGWGPLMKLQEDLCMEQLRAREELLRPEMRSGKSLPAVSEPLRDAGAFGSLAQSLGAPLPRWLLAKLGAK